MQDCTISNLYRMGRPRGLAGFEVGTALAKCSLGSLEMHVKKFIAENPAAHPAAEGLVDEEPLHFNRLERVRRMGGENRVLIYLTSLEIGEV